MNQATGSRFIQEIQPIVRRYAVGTQSKRYARDRHRSQTSDAVTEFSIRLGTMSYPRSAIGDKRDVLIVTRDAVDQKRLGFEHSQAVEILDRGDAGRFPLDASLTQPLGKRAR